MPVCSRGRSRKKARKRRMIPGKNRRARSCYSNALLVGIHGSAAITDHERDEDSFIPYVTEDLEQCAFVADSFCDQLLPRTTQILLEYNSGKWVPRLREPRDLYGLSPAGDLHLVRWPHQYEVIREKIKHIEWIPSHPELLYNPTGLEIEPPCPDPGEGAVVYLADEADKDPSFRYSRIGGSFPSKQVLPQSWNDWDNTLIFEARFESGNLQKVVKINDFEYQLTLRTDLYTNKHTQWYYFQVTNTQAGMPYRFTIVNFTKPTSLYNRGMRDSDNAQLLRDTFIFKVVPMLNPDGVIVGNYRCSLAGKDLNRNYRSDLKDSFPSIWYTRSMIKRIMEERNVLLYCDLHGHSRKENVFMYGCEKKEQDERACLLQRIFPFIMNKNCPDKFSFQDCSFKIQKGKEGTGRVAMWKMGINNSYTLEVTFCGSKLGNSNATHFNTKDLESIGYNFCDSLLVFCTEKKSKYNECLKELEELVKQDDPAACVNDIGDRGDSSSDSSDSNEFADKTETQTKSKKKYLKVKKERSFVLESSGRRYSKHLHEPVNESQKHEDPSRKVSKTQEQIIKNAQVFQKLKLMELQNMEREKYEINKQNVETFSRTTNAKKSKTLAGVHELFKETSSILKSKADQMAFPSKKDAVPNVPSKYTIQYLSHYFPEQGLNFGWDLAQPFKHAVSQRLFLPPTSHNQMCNTPRRNSALLGCRLPRVENMKREVSIHRKTSFIQLDSHPRGVKLPAHGPDASSQNRAHPIASNGEKVLIHGKYSQPTEKYLRSERHLKSLSRHRPRLATLLTTKGPNKTILMKHSEDDETSGHGTTDLTFCSESTPVQRNRTKTKGKSADVSTRSEEQNQIKQ
ncbi:cytosolic carboxypeptidase 3-like [Crotalus adamanteus]|uniref:Cytosolic carboxypeptidase 3-like n=1 Tax=Crotalus adamanteus TaxID=8729 RepID=A0AAW1BCX2_CROAD